MPFIFQVLATAAAVAFSFAMLVKVGVPMFIAAFLALSAGYFIYRWENAERDDNDPAWVNWMCSIKDVRDISKYLNQIF